jgi:hypothetical protein
LQHYFILLFKTLTQPGKTLFKLGEPSYKSPGRGPLPEGPDEQDDGNSNSKGQEPETPKH